MKRKNLDHHGFTVVEVIVDFSVTLIIVYLLFNIIIDLKNLYVKDGVKTELFIKQGLMTKSTVEGVNRDDLIGVTKCTDVSNCYRFSYQDGSSQDLIYNTSTGVYQFGSFKTKLVSGSSFGTVSVTKQTISGIATGKKDSILTIQIPVKSGLVDGDYGIKVVYLYDDSKVTMSGF